MKCLPLFLLLTFLTGYSQQSTDTIYGTPKSVKEKVVFLNKKKQNYRFLSIDGDYGHATIFTPENINKVYRRHWYENIGCFYINYHKEFLRSGKVKNEIWYNKDSSLKRKYEYQYDKSGRLAELKSSYYDDEYRLNKYSYDYNGKIKANISIYSDVTDQFAYWLYSHDSNGNLIKAVHYNEEGYQGTYYKKFNKKNELISESRHSPNKWKNNENGSSGFMPDSIGTLSKIRDYSYDDKGNKELKINYEELTNKAKGKIIFKYDLNDNLIYKGHARYPVDSIYSYEKYSYNQDELKTRHEYSTINNDDSKNIFTYFYNEENFIKTIHYAYKGGEYKIDYKYKFDSKKNWIEIVKVVNNKPLYKWSRDIKYYKE